jgi:Ser/Thr protein kinase RdoA (MazF antagonist)
MSTVFRLRDARGTVWFLKRHRERERYLAELSAYRRWVPALGTRAPRLRASDDVLQAMILSALPGEPAPWPDPGDGQPSAQRAAEAAIQREAGALLRRFHDAQPTLPWNDFGHAKLDEFDRLAPCASGLVTPLELESARAEVDRLAGAGCAVRVPCHRDYTPRNWLVGADAVRVVDFEWCRLDVWVSDLARLHIGVWERRPDLRDAFLRGYGRELDDTDRATLRGCAVLTAVWLLIKARETGQRSFESASRVALQYLISERP